VDNFPNDHGCVSRTQSFKALPWKHQNIEFPNDQLRLSDAVWFCKL